MKCPKCGYLGFEQVERCRNCGYDFSLTAPAPLPDLTIRPPDLDLVAPADELVLGERVASPSDETPQEVHEALARQESLARSKGSTPELPLFARTLGDEPLIAKPSPPRQPLAVRRATPDAPRLRGERRPSGAAVLETTLLEAADPLPPSPARSRAYDVEPEPESDEDEGLSAVIEPAGLTDRLLAALIDILVLGAVDVVVLYFTLQLCGMPLEDFAQLPRVPFLAFLIIQNGGYLVAFTATGQTLGKMASGIRVVTADGGESPGFSRGFIRTLIWVALAAPAGLGFLSALFSRDGRGLHDKGAGTRVVRLDL
jgi:uncharacterized RDD family membrane protein YckC